MIRFSKTSSIATPSLPKANATMILSREQPLPPRQRLSLISLLRLALVPSCIMASRRSEPYAGVGGTTSPDPYLMVQEPSVKGAMMGRTGYSIPLGPFPSFRFRLMGILATDSPNPGGKLLPPYAAKWLRNWRSSHHADEHGPKRPETFCLQQ